MIMDTLAYSHFVEHKAHIYYHAARGKYGIPSKTLEQCKLEVINDFDESDFLIFSAQRDALKKQTDDQLGTVTWADKSRDTARECISCIRLCPTPDHSEFYREVGKVDEIADEETNELQ